MLIHHNPLVNLKLKDKLKSQNIKLYSIFILPYLKSSADRKPETASFTGQKQSGKFFGKSDLSVWIIKINQAKRNINDRNLNTQFQTDARTNIAEFIESRFINPEKRIGLRLAANKKLLNP